MRKYILTSLMSLFLIAGVSMVLTATESKDKEKTSACCSSKAEATQTASVEGAKACGTSKTAEKAACTDEAKATKTSAKAGCASAAAPGECTKKPSGVSSQRAEVR